MKIISVLFFEILNLKSKTPHLKSNTNEMYSIAEIHFWSCDNKKS